MIDIIGWIGSIIFAICGFPQAIKSYKDGHSNGIGWGLIILWELGELLTLIYVLTKKEYPLIINYIFNLISVSIIFWFKLFSRK